MILASRSPQRRAILEQLGIEFSINPADVEEIVEGEPEVVALENARRKAHAIPAPDAVVLGVDTVVGLAGRIYDKPADADQARATLQALSGHVHEVISGVCLLEEGAERTVVAQTAVQFRELEPSLVEWYVAGQEWLGRAGGYAIQGRGAALISRIEGDYLNVVGLPLAALLELAPWIIGA